MEATDGPLAPTMTWEVNSTARKEVLHASGDEAASLVESAMLLRWRAPELTLLLADRAVAAAGDDRTIVLRAEHLAVFALNRLGRHGAAVHRLLPALRDADIPDELRHELHVELAHCAVGLNEPATALAGLRPVLVAGEDIPPVLRGTALVAAAESSGVLGRGDVVSPALEEADELYREDPELDRDTALLLRATANAVHAAHHRRNGAPAQAEAQASAGRQLLAGLADPEHDSGQVSGQLMLELVLALLDRGEGEAAAQQARPILRRPVRAAAAGAVGWLRLALATRVHLAEGRHEPALTLLADAVEMTQRHGVDAVLAECLEGLSYVHEMRGEFADALHCVRSARAAENRYRRTVEAARAALLEHCAPQRQELAGLVEETAALLPGCGPDPDVADHFVASTHEETDCATAPAEGPAPETAQEPAGDIPGQAGPAVGEEPVPQPRQDDAGEIQSQAVAGEPAADEVREGLFAEVPEELDEQFRESIEGVSGQASPAVVAEPVAEVAADQLDEPQNAERPGADAGEELPPAVDGGELTTSEPPSTSEPSLPPGGRRRRGASGTPIRVSDLLPQSALSTGRSGRRRAENRAGDPEEATSSGLHQTVSAEEHSAGDGEAETLVQSAVQPDISDDSDIQDKADTKDEAHTQDRTRNADRSDTSARPALTLAPRDPSPVTVSSVVNGELNGTVTEENVRQNPPRELLPAGPPPTGPPPAPVLRSFEWGYDGSGGEPESRKLRMGDLLAGALAAFQEGRRPLVDRIDPTLGTGANTGTTNSESADSGVADPGVTDPGIADPETADPGVAHDGTKQRGPQARRTPGLQLASNMLNRDPRNPANALTDPELRLPDLTAEPLWRPPGTGRQSAAGE